MHPEIHDSFPPPRTKSDDHRPSGTVTIAFTDLVGSSRLADQLGDVRFAARIERYSLLVRQSVADHGGSIIKFLGDGFMLAFYSADDALRCMCELKMRAWMEGFANRAGVHIGEPLAVGGDYIGRDVVIASRICDAAAAGEVVASDVVHAVTARKGFGFGSPRILSVRGVEAPVRIFPLS